VKRKVKEEKVLAQALTSAEPEGTPGQLDSLINIGRTRDLNRISTETVWLTYF
jgi:hypothetical protein